MRVDVVGIMMMVFTPLLGLVTPQEAFSGLASNAVVSIIAVMIIGVAWTAPAWWAFWSSRPCAWPGAGPSG